MSRRTRALRDEIADINWQLNDDSERALKTMDAYLQMKNIGTLRCLSVLRDLTQMALDAQTQGRRLDEVIDGDHQAFCDAIIAELPQPTKKERRLCMLRDGLGGLALFWAIAFLLPLFLLYASYSSMPGLWDVVKELGYLSTDTPVMVSQIILLLIGAVAMARRSVSKKTMQANMQFRPRRKALYHVLFFGALLMLDRLLQQGAVPVPDFFSYELAIMPLNVNVMIQAVLVGAFLLVNERVD